MSTLVSYWPSSIASITSGAIQYGALKINSLTIEVTRLRSFTYFQQMNLLDSKWTLNQNQPI